MESMESTEEEKKQKYLCHPCILLPEIKEEAKNVVLLAVPTIATSFLQSFIYEVSVMMCGHLGKEQMDALGLSASLTVSLFVYVSIGFTCACDTLFSQTFGGPNKKQMGLILQRALIMMLPVYIVIASILINAEPILLLFQQDPIIARMTANYILFALPGFYFDFVNIILVRFLQNQDQPYAPLLAYVIGNLLNVVSQGVSIYVFKYSYLAAAVCQTGSCLSITIMQIVYIKYSGVLSVTWNGLQLYEALHNWGSFAKLAIGGIMIICLEGWCIEIGMFVAGAIGIVELGAQNTMAGLLGMTYMIPVGVGVSVSIHVGHYLGAGSPEKAKTAYRAGLVLILFTATITCVYYLALKAYLPFIYSSDPDITRLASMLLPFLAALQYLDALTAIPCGALRGSGRQLIGAAFTTVGFYVIAAPLGIALAIKTSLKLAGFWIGILSGLLFEAVAFLIITFRMDWNEESRKAQETTRSLGYEELVTSSSMCCEKIKELCCNAKCIPDEIDNNKWCLIFKRLLTMSGFLVILAVAIFLRTHPELLFHRSMNMTLPTSTSRP